MAEPKQLLDFSLGINNIAQVDALPAGAVRQLLNVDPVVGGALQTRAQQSLVEAIANCRGAIEIVDDLLIVADRLRRFSPLVGHSVDIGPAPAGTKVIGAELNGDGFLQIGVTQLRVRGNTVGPWAIPEFSVQVTRPTGALQAGVYRVAVTSVDVFGAESGATPIILTLEEGRALQLDWTKPDGAERCKVYVSAADGETLYFQGYADDSYLVSLVRDDQERMTTMNLQPPPLADWIARYKGRLVLASGATLWGTSPFSPHLVDYTSDFVSYDSPITMLQPVDDGIFVATTKRTYFLSNFTREDAALPAKAEFGAVPGSQVLLPDGRATWLTPYGQAFGSPGGGLELPQRERYAPAITEAASAGVVDYNGVQMVVTNLQGAVHQNPLYVSDSFDLEIE